MVTAKPGQMGQTRSPALSGEADVREEATESTRCFFNDLWGLSYLHRKRKKRSRGPSSSSTTLATVILSVKSSMIRIWYLLKQNGWGGGGKKLPKNWVDRDKTYNEFMWIMGQKVQCELLGGRVVGVDGSQPEPVCVEDE